MVWMKSSLCSSINGSQTLNANNKTQQQITLTISMDIINNILIHIQYVKVSYKFAHFGGC